MVLAFAFVLALVMMIPILAIVFDSPVGQALARRISSDEKAGDLTSRVDAMEGELRYLTETVTSLAEEAQFLRSLVEGPEEPPRLESGEAGETGQPKADG